MIDLKVPVGNCQECQGASHNRRPREIGAWRESVQASSFNIECNQCIYRTVLPLAITTFTQRESILGQDSPRYIVTEGSSGGSIWRRELAICSIG